MPKATPSSQDFVAIKDIKDGVVILKSGQMCSVLLASSINFALKSGDEQQAILHHFQSFLNTLDFSLQIYVQSRRLNIEPYLALLATRESLQDNDLMRIQLEQRVSVVEQGLSRIGVRTIPLKSEDLVELYYHIYNPTDPTGAAPVFNT